MKTIWEVWMYIDNGQLSPQEECDGGYGKKYALFTNKNEAEIVAKRLNELGTLGLRKLKILKSYEVFNGSFVSMPYAYDNYEPIIDKLTNK